MKYLIIRRTALFEDGWTYGDWRQYVAWRDDGTASCVRMSRLPFVLGLIGTLAVGRVTLTVLNLPTWQVAWGRAYATLAVGLFMAGVAGWFTFTPWRLTVIVGKVRKRPDGGHERVLAGDKE